GENMPVNWHIVNCRFSRKMGHLANHVAPRVLQPNDASDLPATQAPGPLRTPDAEGCPRPGEYALPKGHPRGHCVGALRWGAAQPRGSVRWRPAELGQDFGTSGLQDFSSARTILRPATIASSFANATARGRYFMPQSGAMTSRSGATWRSAPRI